MSRGLENRNPGNIRQSRVRYKGEVRPSRDPEFKQFESPAWGYRAIFVLLDTYRRRHGLRRLREMISRWAPPSENRTEAYIRAVADDTGIDPDEPTDTRDRKTMVPVAASISRVENGVAADRRQVDRGWELFAECPPPEGSGTGKQVRRRTPAAERRTDGHGARKEGKTAGQRPPERTGRRRRSRRAEKTGTNASAAGKPGPGGGFASEFAIFASEQTIRTCRSGSYSHGSTGCRC